MGFGDDLENSPPPPAGRSARPKRAKSDDDAADENDDAAADTGPSANEKCADELQEFAKKTAEMRKKLKTYGSKRDDKAFRDRFRREREKLKTTGKGVIHRIQKLPGQENRAMQLKLVQQYKQMDADLAKILEESKRLEQEHLVQQPPPPPKVEVACGDIQIEMEEHNDDDLQAERNAELLNVESDMLDLADIVGDLSNMVNDQGEAIDKIEKNVVEARDNVNEGASELVSAAEHQKSARRKQVILAAGVVLGLIAGGIAIWFIFFRGGGGDGDDGEAAAPATADGPTAAVTPPAPAGPSAPAAPAPTFPAGRRLLQLLFIRL